jgi:hypothetical protein
MAITLFLSICISPSVYVCVYSDGAIHYCAHDIKVQVHQSSQWLICLGYVPVIPNLLVV